MTAALLRLWTMPRLNVVIRTHPVLVRAVLQKKLFGRINGRSGKLSLEKAVAPKADNNKLRVSRYN